MTWEDNYLAHHGIKGQKWGVRRFQNEDGTLTAEGRQQYGYNEGFVSRQKQRTPWYIRKDGPRHEPSPQERMEESMRRRREARRAELKKLAKNAVVKKNKIKEKEIERGKKLSEKGASQFTNAISGGAMHLSLRLINSFASTVVASSGHTRLASGVRHLGNAFIVANGVNTLRNAYDIAAYKKEKRLYKK